MREQILARYALTSSRKSFHQMVVEESIRVQIAVADIVVRAAVKSVGAGACDRVDHRSVSAELGAVGIG